MEPIEQALFTSAETKRASGYHLVAASPGVTGPDARALSAWGPSEDALLDQRAGSQSINFHPLPSGCRCISRTTVAGTEYSGRGSRRLVTQCLIVAPGVLARFANNPFALLRAAISGGQMPLDEGPAPDLQPFCLVGHAAAVETTLLLRLCLNPGPAWMAALVRAALELEQFAIANGPPAERLIAGLFSCLPRGQRPEASFSTGLRFSVRRPFRVVTLPREPDERGRAQRAAQVPVFDLSGQPPEEFAPQDGWTELIYHVLRSRRIDAFAHHLARHTSEPPSSGLPEWGARMLRELGAVAAD